MSNTNTAIKKYNLTLRSNNWSDDSQQLSVPGLVETSYTMVFPKPDYIGQYNGCNVRNSYNTEGVMHFTCGARPEVDLEITVVLWDGVIEGEEEEFNYYNFIPKMSANTSDDGEVISNYYTTVVSSGNNDSTRNYEIFAQNTSGSGSGTEFYPRAAIASENITNAYIGYHFNGLARIGGVIITLSPYGKSFNYQFQVSNDGTNWTTIASDSLQSNNYVTKIYTWDEVITAYFRVLILTLKSSGNDFFITNMQINPI